MTIDWNAEQTRGSTAAGHRVFVLVNQHTKTRVVQVMPPPGHRLTELVVAVEDPVAIAGEAQRLVGMTL